MANSDIRQSREGLLESIYPFDCRDGIASGQFRRRVTDLRTHPIET